MGSAYTVLFLCLGCTFCGTEGAPVAVDPGLNAQPAHFGRAADAARCGAQQASNSQGVCVPEAWYCGPTYYEGGVPDGCDCDCGTTDPDCALSGVDHWCYNLGRPRHVATCEDCTTLKGTF